MHQSKLTESQRCHHSFSLLKNTICDNALLSVKATVSSLQFIHHNAAAKEGRYEDSRSMNLHILKKQHSKSMLIASRESSWFNHLMSCVCWCKLVENVIIKAVNFTFSGLLSYWRPPAPTLTPYCCCLIWNCGVNETGQRLNETLLESCSGGRKQLSMLSWGKGFLFTCWRQSIKNGIHQADRWKLQLWCWKGNRFRRAACGSLI